MATQRQVRRSSAANLALTTPVEGEVGYDTTNKRIIVGDGSTTGGIPHVNFTDQIGQTFLAADATGTNTIAVTLPQAISAYAKYMRIVFMPANDITGAITINVNGVGAAAGKKVSGGSLVDLEAGDMLAAGIYAFVYTGTVWLLENAAGGAGGTTEILYDEAMSAAASHDFDIDGDFDGWEIELTLNGFNGIGTPFFRYSTDGSTFISAGYYHKGWNATTSAPTNVEIDSASGGYFTLSSSNSIFVAGDSLSVRLVIGNTSGNGEAIRTDIFGACGDAGGERNTGAGICFVASTANPTDIRIGTNSGNIVGHIKITGKKNG